MADALDKCHLVSSYEQHRAQNQALKGKQARQRFLSLATSIKYQRRIHMSSKLVHEFLNEYVFDGGRRFTEWAKQYGGLFTLKVGSGTMAVITDRRLIKETVDKKSNIYSHRPPSFVSHDLITQGDHVLVMHYGNQWRTLRRLIHQHLMEAMVESTHLQIVDAEAIQLVRDYLMFPEDHMLHPKRFSNSISNSISKSITAVRGTYSS